MKKVIALAGNPNVGKSTVFNELTHLRQHTGNWPGKTVDVARGEYTYEGEAYMLVDLPGTYSLAAHSPEEAVTRDFLLSGEGDAAVVVCDATCLERSLNLVFQTVELTRRVVVCVNLMDEAEKKGIRVDTEALSRRLGVPVIPTAAGRGRGLEELRAAVAAAAHGRVAALPLPPGGETVEGKIRLAEELAGEAVSQQQKDPSRRDRRLDRLLTSRRTGIPLMLLLLTGVLWLTIEGANLPSGALTALFARGEDGLTLLFSRLHAPQWLHGAVVLGMYRVLTWVVAVMLPPMAIFFPLFTLLEDLGYLPRVAFVLDHAFQKAHTCGKQALTMCLGFGCNACGVTGCRIIDSPRERLIAILTNPFVPCNGRFPTLIAIITLFFLSDGEGSGLASAALLTGVIALGVLVTFWVSKLLSHTLLKGMPSSFALELPPYRMPRVGQVLVRSLLDRTLFVLGRAVLVAAPAGLVIWLFANITVEGQSVLAWCAGFLDPFARVFGLDGVILMAFLLGLPANEIVVPIMLMAYLSGGTLMEMEELSQMGAVLRENGWTEVTAVCTVLFCLFHWPCSTTCLTVRKETGSWKWTAVAVFLPTAVGLLACFLVASGARLLGL